MKDVIAVVRPEKGMATVEAIRSFGVEHVFHQRVLGRGRQRGLRYLRREPEGGGGDMLFLPKRLVRCFVEDALVSEVVSAIMKVNQTGNVGDGKVFVRPLFALSAEAAVSEAIAATTA